MPSIEKARELVINDVVGCIDDSDAIVSSLSKTLSRATELRDRVNNVRKDADDLRKAETLPMEFTGIIHNYRFGMLDADLPETEKKPTHRFEVEVPKVGLWLHVRVTSDKFDDFLTTTDIKAFKGAESLNGREVTVRRDPGYGRLIPIGLGITSAEKEPLGTDRQGKPLFKGDTVRLKGPRRPDFFNASRDITRVFKATVVDFDGAKWIFQRKDRKTQTSITTTQLRKYQIFEKV